MVALVSGVTASANSNVITPGQVIADGEIAYILYSYTATSPFNVPTSYTPPTGFVELALLDDGATNAIYSQLVVFRRVVVGTSEPATYTVTPDNGTFYNEHIGIIAYSGGDTSDPDGTPTTAITATRTTPITIPALTTDLDDSFDLAVVTHGAAFVATQSFNTWGDSLVELISISSDWSSLVVAHVARATAGAQAATEVNQGSTDYGLSIRLEVNEAPASAGNPWYYYAQQ